MAMPDTARPSAIVLVVEDEPLQRMMMVDSIEEGGFDALEAWSAEGAAALLADRSEVRLVLTDVDMPGGMDGIALATLIRDRWPAIKVIVTSAGPAPDASKLPDGAIFMPKPLDRDKLMKTLAALSGRLDQEPR